MGAIEIAKKKERYNLAPNYPQSAGEWRTVITRGFGLSSSKGKARYKAGTFPFEDLASWLRQEFGASRGYSVDFVPALVRNLRGLVAWVYGDASEPYWPGRDSA